MNIQCSYVLKHLNLILKLKARESERSMSHVQACLETSLEYQNQYLQGFKQRF